MVVVVLVWRLVVLGMQCGGEGCVLCNMVGV